ncbi:MAG: DNA starvation/stationary phase protection protein [Niabella sp.]
MKTLIGIPAEARKVASEQLSILLADEFVLYTKTLNAHWNVEGPDFFAAHQFFESLYTEAVPLIDEVAERIRQLGHYVEGNLKTFLKITHLSEQYEGDSSSQSYTKDLLRDHESVIEFIRASIEEFEETHKDAGTIDFITSIMEKHEKTAWMLRSHLK